MQHTDNDPWQYHVPPTITSLLWAVTVQTDDVTVVVVIIGN